MMMEGLVKGGNKFGSSNRRGESVAYSDHVDFGKGPLRFIQHDSQLFNPGAECAGVNSKCLGRTSRPGDFTA